ncbi:hypothetical protein [Chengkuizengella axinellae]|uniref:Uncharacterized protein n=1 Tax=Chengkuizengella axinellae TaxID=3064388 RepID=A0ABT9IV12_9BACL|nr:hypothetical protein [Chengkuizengella sp. 2205SS18-9]MDP5273204.1 hypothetical protein [Chengkuizengella sp. 2205SS18-9]
MSRLGEIKVSKNEGMLDQLAQIGLELLSYRKKLDDLRRYKEFYEAKYMAKGELDLLLGQVLIPNRFKFIINREKRTVVALRIYNRKVENRSVAKCSPNDVFDEDIGKVIALRRALKFEVPETLFEYWNKNLTIRLEAMHMENKDYIVLQSRVLTVTKINRKTKAEMFGNLRVGSKIELSVPVERAGRNRGTYATYITARNVENNEITIGSFNQLPKLLDAFEFEESE